MICFWGHHNQKSKDKLNRYRRAVRIGTDYVFLSGPLMGDSQACLFEACCMSNLGLSSSRFFIRENTVYHRGQVLVVYCSTTNLTP